MTSGPHGNPRPNILLVVVDDMGFSDIEPYGGEIRTPSLTKLANRGVRFTNFHVSSLCAPTRAMLLTGVDNHQAGLGTMPPFHATNQYLQPGYEGPLNHRAATIAELLRDGGYHTYMAGKWHLGSIDGFRPENRGFERVFSFLGGGVSHFDDARPLSDAEAPHSRYVEDGQDVTDDLPEGFFSSDSYTDKLIGYLSDQDDDRPFFAYLAFTAPHDPLQVPDAWLDKYRGGYADGYESLRERRLARMKELGLVAHDLDPHPGSGQFPRWEDLSDEERARQARKMEIYAAMIENADHNIGRILDFLDGKGKLEDTLIVFLSDNGANPKEPHFYPPNSEEQIDFEFDNRIENMGRKGSFVSVGGAWAEACNTPLAYWKTTTYEGGMRVPLILCGPGIGKQGINSSQRLHATDLVPTILDYVGLERPAERKGTQLAPIQGRSWKPYLSQATLHPVRGPFDVIGFEMFECRAILKGDWKLILVPPPNGDNAWHLYNLSDDPGELNNIAKQHPGKLAELKAEWDAYAAAVGYIKAGETKQLERMSPAEFYQYAGLVQKFRTYDPDNIAWSQMRHRYGVTDFGIVLGRLGGLDLKLPRAPADRPTPARQWLRGALKERLSTPRRICSATMRAGA